MPDVLIEVSVFDADLFTGRQRDAVSFSLPFPLQLTAESR